MTDQPRNVPPIKLRIEEDASSFSRVEQRTAETFNRINALAKANDAVTQSAQQMGRTLHDALAQGATQIDANTRAVQSLRKEVHGLGADQERAAGGGRLNVEGLRRTGGALSQLGLTGIGGAISQAGDIGQIAKEADNLGKGLGGIGVALGPLAAGIGAVAAGVKLWNDGLSDADKRILKSTDEISTYFGVIKTGTAEAVQAKLREAQLDKATLDAELKARQDNLKDMEDKALAKSRKELDFFAELNVELEQAGLRSGGLTQKIDELKKQSEDAQMRIDTYNKVLKDNATAANDAAAKEQKLADARKDAFQQGLDNEIEIQKLIESGDKKGLEKQKASREAELAIIQRWLEANAEKVAGDEQLAKTYDEAEKKAQKLRNEINNLNTAIGGIKPDIIGDFLKKAKDTADRIAKEVSDRNARVATVQQKYEDDSATIQERALQKKADIEKRYADRLVEIARQAADAAEAALTKLTQQREDLLTGLNRDLDKSQRDAAAKELDIQITAQREEVKALRDHQREVEQIRKDANAREVEFLVTRNFQGLYLSRLQTSRDIERSNDQFGATRTDRQSELQGQFEDLKRATQRERQERLIAYQQALVDAQTAYKRELLQAQQKRAAELMLARQEEQAALTLASQAASNELRIRATMYQRDLQLAAQYGAAYVKTHDQMMQALVNRAEQRLAMTTGASGGSTGGGGTRGAVYLRAGGGDLQAGQRALVNERPGQRESFNGVPFPPGLGMFIPAQSGKVSPGATGPITLNVYPSPGMDEERFAHKTLDLLESVIGPRR